MDTQLEEKIQSEIQKRVFDEEEKKRQREGNLASQEALSEVSGLSRQEIEQIERTVRQEDPSTRTVAQKISTEFHYCWYCCARPCGRDAGIPIQSHCQP